MRILYFETTEHSPSSPLFLEALQRLAAERDVDYRFFDEAWFLKPPSLAGRAARRLLRTRPWGYHALNRALLDEARRFRPSMMLVGKGSRIAPSTLGAIKRETRAFLVNYAADDPFNPRSSTRDLVESIPLFDLYACTKTGIMEDIKRAGCRAVAYVPFAYKPEHHFPEYPVDAVEAKRFDSEVVFIGGGDKDRVPYFRALVRKLPGVMLHLYGGYWNRDSELAPYHRGFVRGREFRLALGGAKVAVNLVRRANRDGHVMRSFEIPACGAFMLAESTEEHRRFYREGVEAEYFTSPDEMARKVEYFLLNETERRRIAEAGYRAVVRGGHTYTQRLLQIIGTVQRLRNRDLIRAGHPQIRIVSHGNGARRS